MREKKGVHRILLLLLIAGSVLAALKMIFVDYSLDEEYQVVMAYRRLSGERLFATMWEPHQTSAFVCVLLMWPFRLLTGGYNGVVIWLRVCTTAVQLLLTGWFYRVISRILKKENAFLLSLCFFNIVPKNIQIPEFGNLQVWFFTVAVLALMEYYAGDGRICYGGNGRKWWLILAGVAMALEVLSYPSMLLLFPFLLGWIWFWSAGQPASGSGTDMEPSGGKKTKGRWQGSFRDCLLFGMTCGVCAVIWLVNVLSAVPFDEFLRNVQNVLAFDLTHDVALENGSRLLNIIRGLQCLQLSAIVIPVGGIICLAVWFLGWGRKLSWKEEAKEQDIGYQKKLTVCLMVISLGMFFTAQLLQLYYWVWRGEGYEVPMVHLLICWFSGLLVWRFAGSSRKVLFPGILGALVTMAAVIYMSDLSAVYAIGHGMTGALFMLAIFLMAMENMLEEKQGQFWCRAVLVVFCLMCLVGKGYVLRAGATETNSILGVRGIIRKGPAMGIFTNYMQAHMSDCTYEEFSQWMEEGEKCLIVTDLIRTPGTTPYLFRESEICHFSIVDPTSYDERLMEYWKLYPDKMPDIIVTDCWFGQEKLAPDSWIKRFIEEESGYTQVQDGSYYRYYFK